MVDEVDGREPWLIDSDYGDVIVVVELQVEVRPRMVVVVNRGRIWGRGAAMILDYRNWTQRELKTVEDRRQGSDRTAGVDSGVGLSTACDEEDEAGGDVGLICNGLVKVMVGTVQTAIGISGFRRHGLLQRRWEEAAAGEADWVKRKWFRRDWRIGKEGKELELMDEVVNLNKDECVEEKIGTERKEEEKRKVAGRKNREEGGKGENTGLGRVDGCVGVDRNSWVQ
ncbi:hypothetical protein M0R45_026113 [Rubus argutus]|uniref:Uncharacterized protein n=1 Tax=Rubus argutus TaxID=59490 RepID=A0AAW1WWL5_RUBAR